MDATWIDSRRLARRAHRPPTPAGYDRLELARGSIRFRVDGHAGPAVAFAPDGPNVAEHYDELVGRIGDRHRVLRFELPGFGYSFPRRGYRFTLADQAAVAAEVLERVGLAPYVLAFSCSNAYVALRVAALRPDLVSGLVLIQAPSWTDEQRWIERIDPSRVMRRAGVGQLVSAAAPARLARAWYGAALPEGERFDHFYGPAEDVLRHGGCFCLGSLIQANSGPQPDFGAVEQPALAVWGGSDGTHRHSDGRSILEHVPAARWLHFESAGHFPELEESERFARELERFTSELA